MVGPAPSGLERGLALARCASGPSYTSGLAVRVVFARLFTMATEPTSPIQIPTPEEVRKLHDEGVRIMSITMPHALKQMQTMYQRTPDQTHARFVHYTTAEAALNIIRTKRFWLRNTNCMSDYREVQHGFDIFNRYFLDAAKRKAFVDAFDACTPGVADDAFTAFNNWWQDLRINTYLACVSEHQDSEDVHVASLRRNGHARRHRAPFPVRLDFRSVSRPQLQPGRLLVGICRSRRHRSSHRKRSGEPRTTFVHSKGRFWSSSFFRCLLPESFV